MHHERPTSSQSSSNARNLVFKNSRNQLIRRGKGRGNGSLSRAIQKQKRTSLETVEEEGSNSSVSPRKHEDLESTTAGWEVIPIVDDADFSVFDDFDEPDDSKNFPSITSPSRGVMIEGVGLCVPVIRVTPPDDDEDEFEWECSSEGSTVVDDGELESENVDERGNWLEGSGVGSDSGTRVRRVLRGWGEFGDIGQEEQEQEERVDVSVFEVSDDESEEA
ncbi:hypothetical protein BDN72DRAFT_841088 [Pluteus cervinus]|uniref:Uncharacterized protein n=1 Tax=Pluteus cervinus TaxID=181527 RepID=A0ACD3ATZ2_9AGAR|nr:hypothetical protein BDN72DRAFT_841088 [Pluteus cervinus]